MSCFYVDVTFFNLNDRAKSAVVKRMLVDTGSDKTWVPADVLEGIGIERAKKDRPFQMANGQRITRATGYAFVQVTPEYETVDEIVFAEPGDLSLLGARSLEGLGVRVDPEDQQLVAAGPAPAAGNITATTTTPTTE